VKWPNVWPLVTHATVILQKYYMSTTLSKSQHFPAKFLAVMAETRVDKERGERIERLMERQGWKIAPLARAIGIDRKRIYEWRSGEPIGSDSLERLAVALETDRLYIETGEGEPHRPREEPPALLLKRLLDAAADHEPLDA